MTGAATEILPAHLPSEVVDAGEALMLPTMSIPDTGISLVSVLSTIERELINRCLQKTGGNKRQAAKLLQLSRTTLIDKLRRLNPPKKEETDDDENDSQLASV